MITVESLEEMLLNEGYPYMESWFKIKPYLEPTQEAQPVGPPYLDEYGNECQDYETVTVNGCARTYEEDLVELLWKFGCTVTFTRDWVDGSPTFYVSLPETEEEYQNNVKEAEEFWKENYEM